MNSCLVMERELDKIFNLMKMAKVKKIFLPQLQKFKWKLEQLKISMEGGKKEKLNCSK